MTAHADWKYNNSNNMGDAYIDYSRIKNEGKYKSLWNLFDLNSTETNSSGKQYKSMVLKKVIDCQFSRTQIVALYCYSEKMGKGEVVVSENYQIQESEWQYPPPNSISEGSINIACGKK